jgi:hypothetical protein
VGDVAELGALGRHAVLLTHDHHDDNLDPAGRALLPAADTVITTVSGSKRLGRETRGLEPWATTVLEAPGSDTVLYDGVRQVADRLQVDVALLHLGGVQFPVTGPVGYTLTAKDAVELCRLIRPRTAIPIHYEGWKPSSAERRLSASSGVRLKTYSDGSVGCPWELKQSSPGEVGVTPPASRASGLHDCTL